MKRYSLEEAKQELEVFTNKVESVILSTVSNEGEPFASYSPFVEDEDGNYYVFISTAVMHSHNMSATKKAHIMFLEDESTASHIYARQRLYFRASVEVFEENDKNESKIFKLFDDKFQSRVSFFSTQKDSRIYKLIPKNGNIVLGFGSAFKISDDRKTLTLNDKGHSKSHSKGLENHGKTK